MLMTGWSLAVTAPCREARVSDVLKQFSFDHYVFKLRKNIVRNGRIFTLLVPAFPSYVFVAARNSWDFIRDVTDVVGFVKFGGTVAEVPDADVRALAHRAEGEKWVLPQDEPAQRFTRGQKVRITSGALQGMATYDRMASPGRAIVLVDTLGRLVPVSVLEDDLDTLIDDKRVRRAKHHRPRRHRYLC
jgi:transcription antitermination factor NusG